MRLRFLDSIAGIVPSTGKDYSYAANEVVDLNDPELIADFLQGGIAVEEQATASMGQNETTTRRRGRPRKQQG